MEVILHPTAQIIDADLISPHIFIGACSVTNKPNWLIENRIKYILNIGSPISYDSRSYDNSELSSIDAISYIKFKAHDHPSFQIHQIFDECYQLIDEAVNTKCNILVHCASGISRSSTIVISYLMKKNNWSCQETLNYVRQKRHCINPNVGFINQLYDYEKSISKEWSNR
jgi:protein tyrosine phosphatase